MQLTYAETDKVYSHLWDLKRDRSDLSRADRAVLLIGACILHGFDTKNQILKGLRFAGVKGDYVIDLLDEQTGNVTGLHLWRCDEAGHYHVLEAAK
jgi:hypothetical protein